ncbi:MAG: glycosyltransferase [Thermodesulfobacteriota bacterium]
MMAENKLFDIIIVNYKSTEYLLECIRTIHESLGEIPADIFIKDNGGENLDAVLKAYPKVDIETFGVNLGFAAAVNRAIKDCSAPFIVLLNPDTKIEGNFFRLAIQYLQDQPDVGVIGPKIFNQDGSVQGSARAFPTLFSGFFGRTSLLTRLFPNNWITRKNILTGRINGTDPVNVDWVSGACMIVRRTAIEDVGGMDEQFFMYWEDVDWCKRMWMKGWRVVYYPKTHLVHYVGGSSDKRPLRSMLYFHRSCYLYFGKYSAQPQFLIKTLALFGLSLRFLFLSLLYLLRRQWFSKRTGSKRSVPKILFLITEDWYFWSHRLPIARLAKKAGFDVLVATRVHLHRERIEAEGLKVIPIPLERKSRRIIKEFMDFLEIIKIYRRERPDIVHHVAIKPILYGSWAAWIVNIPVVVNAVAGLGFVFVAQGRRSAWIRGIVKFAYRMAFLPKNTAGIFQNPDDRKLFVDANIVKRSQTVLIRGSGVDIERFRYRRESEDAPKVILASRMLWDKGVGEFIEAATTVKRRFPHCRMILVGDPDPENPMSIPDAVLQNLNREGIVEWWGHRDDMPEVFETANIVVLPSYREGLPKVLLEAASCGRAIVAANVPGCREIVRHMVNGLLVPPYDPKALAHAILVLLTDAGLRRKMGARSREIVEREFSDRFVAEQTIKQYTQHLSRVRGHLPLLSNVESVSQ